MRSEEAPAKPPGRPPGKKYITKINLLADEDLLDRLTAFSYIRGRNGKGMTTLARELTSFGLDTCLGSLDEKKRAEYETILQNVRLMRANSLPKIACSPPPEGEPVQE